MRRTLHIASIALSLLLVSLRPANAEEVSGASCRFGDGFAGQGPDFYVLATAVYDDGSGPALYAGGEFRTIGARIARWDGVSWAPLTDATTGLQGIDATDTGVEVNALAVYDDGGGAALYAAGEFTSAGGVTTTNIARWDGARWSALTDSGTGLEGLDDRVLALAVYDDGDGAALYATGDFGSAGGVTTSGIARWDGSQWTPLTDSGTGVEGMDGAVYSVAPYDDGGGTDLYAGGFFETAGGVAANRIARWDGTSWTPLVDAGTATDGVDGNVTALVTYDDGGGLALHAAGAFTSAGGKTASRVARWDGSTWSPLTDASTAEEGVDRTVRALGVYDDGDGAALYVGGSMDEAGGVVASGIARWNGTRWSALTDTGTGEEGVPVGEVYAMASYDDGEGAALFVGGTFPAAGGVPAPNIARWDGASWERLVPTGPGAAGVSAEIRDFVVWEDGGGEALFAGGVLGQAGGVTVSGLGRFDGTGWTALTDTGTGVPGTNAAVQALAVWDDGDGRALYAVGGFGTAGDRTANGIARWDGTTWSALTDTGSGQQGLDGGGLGIVRAVAVYDDGNGSALYAAGDFSTAGGAPATGIARWDGASWTPLTDVGTGQQGLSRSGGFPFPYALAVFDDGGGPALYVGGVFDAAGGVPVTGIARWDGTHWTALTDAGTGQEGVARVLDMAVHTDGGGAALYVGGDFATAGGVTATDLARWDGSNWSPVPDVGSGLEGTSGGYVAEVVSLDLGGGADLFVGGRFGEIAGVTATTVARWDGTSWSAITDEVTGIQGTTGVTFNNDGVQALGAFDGGAGPTLYVGGDITSAGGRPSSFIAAYSCGIGPEIFDDGFESGDTSRWAATVPAPGRAQGTTVGQALVLPLSKPSAKIGASNSIRTE